MIASASVTGKPIAFASAFPTSYGDHGPTHHLFVRVETDDGVVGYGEGSALTWFTGETSGTMEQVARELFLPELKGVSVTEALAAVRDLADRLPGHPGAKAGVEMALLDARAKQLGVPVHSLLGTARRDTVNVAYASGALPAETVTENVAAAFEEGFRTFKIKVDGDIAGDAARINAVTRELADRADPGEVFVRADANTGWRNYETARRAIDRIERHEYIEYFEQPVDADAPEDLRALRLSRGVPVFADEAIHDVAAVRDLTETPAAVSGFCAKLAKTGSLVDIANMGGLSTERDAPMTLVSAFESSLGLAANLHIAAVLPNPSSAAELGADLIDTDPVDEHIPTRPEFPVPEGPGLGVALDDDLFD